MINRVGINISTMTMKKITSTGNCFSGAHKSTQAVKKAPSQKNTERQKGNQIQ